MQVAVLLILMLLRFSFAFGGIECSNYKVLEEADRSMTFSNPSVKKCDKNMHFGWYRFRGVAGTMMPTSCVPTFKCGTDAPGWLQGRHPSTSEGVIQAKVCFHWGSNCCQWSSSIRVRNCGSFYVYQLVGSPTCSLRYCGNGAQSPGPVNPPGPNPAPGPVNAPECSSHNFLEEADRSMAFSNPSVKKCDKNMQFGWYRFRGVAGTMMPTSCVPMFKCGTDAPGWLQGRHPSTSEGVIQAKVCFHWGSNCCQWSSSIRVRNCGSFYVYQLVGSSTCSLRYCGNGAQSPGPVNPPGPNPAPGPVNAPECSSHNFLEEADRSMAFSNPSVKKCDKNMQFGWYRFRGVAGTMMPTSCVPMFKCGTDAPGWLQGRHPSTSEGVIQAKVCFHWGSNCCQWSSFIRVRNCGSFYVYQLVGSSTCSLRYCGNGAQSPGPVNPPGPNPAPGSVNAPECSSHNFLEEADRSMAFSNPSVKKCDKNMQFGWYRFRGVAGTMMPTSCVPMFKCGTDAPGWLQGRHPSTSEGVIQAKVCFHWGSNCCQWSSSIRVRNCGSFYVYQLVGSSTCSLRYCGNGAQNPVPGPGPIGPPGNVECGTRAQGSRIVGGTQARPGSWPWQVTIDYKGHPASHWCGGSIVSPQWIVSAAHCFTTTKDTKQYTLVAGDHDLNANDGYEQNIPIEKIISHPQYGGHSHDYDVALLKLQSPLTYNDRVRPVCLPQSNFPANTNCYVTGWGATSEGGGSPQILRQAQVPLITRNTCQAGYQDLGYTITPRMLCAGYAQGGIDACQGDSGGPLVCPGGRSGTKWYLSGAVSWGQGCARKGRYGVYADIMNLKNWVQQTMNKN